MGGLCQNVPPFPEHCQKLSLIGVNGDNSKVDWMSVLVMKLPALCLRTRIKGIINPNVLEDEFLDRYVGI